MVVKCEDVWREISNYIDEDLDPTLKQAMDEHFAQCRDCMAVLEGTRNIVQLYGDDEMFTLPAGYYPRLHVRLADQIEGPKGSRLGWLVSIAAVGVLAACTLFARQRDRFAPEPRAQMSQPTRRMPQQLVAVVEGGKIFHVPECEFMHGKYRMVTPEEAVREGYTPCSRCISEALRSANKVKPALDGKEIASNETGAK